MVRKVSKSTLLILLSMLLFSCRGQQFKKPPIHPNLNMDQQKRFEAQESNPFFADDRSMRQPVPGTIARGHLHQDPVYYQGINADSSFVEKIPVEITKSFIYRGQNRFNIYCTPCHGVLGNGQGIVTTGGYGFVPAPSYHQDRLRNVEDGYIFSVITNGVRTMPSYAHQIKVKDRWAIVAYIRALQRSQNESEEDVKKYGVDLTALQTAYEEEQQKQQAQQEAQASSSASAEEVSVERGKELYAANACQACHSIDGSKSIGPTHLNLMGRKEKMSDGSTITIDEAYLRESIVDPTAKVVEGYNPVMPPFNNLSDSEVQSLVEYLKSLSNNQ